MVYVETRTSHVEVLADVAHELVAMANVVINNVDTRIDHPTYLTKTDVRTNFQMLRGAYELAARVSGGAHLLPNDAQVKYAAACVAMEKLR